MVDIMTFNKKGDTPVHVKTARSLSQAMKDRFGDQFEQHFQKLVNTYEFNTVQTLIKWSEFRKSFKHRIEAFENQARRIQSMFRAHIIDYCPYCGIFIQQYQKPDYDDGL